MYSVVYFFFCRESKDFKKTDAHKKIEELNQTIEEKKIVFSKLVDDSNAMYKKIVKKVN